MGKAASDEEENQWEWVEEDANVLSHQTSNIKCSKVIL
jgi:hypothetical protein